MSREQGLGGRPDVVNPLAVGLARTKSGLVFDASQDIWAYRDGVEKVKLDFSAFSNASRPLIEATQGVFKWYAEHRSPAHTQNLYQRLLHFLRSMAPAQVESISAAHLLSYRAQLKTSNQWYLGNLSGLLRQWRRLGYPCVDSDVELLLKQLRIKGNQKGVAVLTVDPDEGPFTNLEIEALQAALNAAYAAGQMPTATYVLAWLYMLLGQRNKQHAALKVCDVRVTESTDGAKSYSIMMPSVKNRESSPRAVLVERMLIEHFGEVLATYAETVRQQFASVLDDPSQAPLFPVTRYTEGEGTEGFEFHRTAGDIGQILTQAIKGLSVISERTGLPMHISPRRFRRTIGTRAAEEGHSPLVIAGLLNHTDTQNVGVYAANSTKIIERIDRAVAMKMAPLAQAFAGVLVPTTDSQDPGRRIIDLRIDRSGAPIGDCGKHGFCRFNAPIACYTCVNFEAWVDGPHDAVLDHLLGQRERHLLTTDKRIASINDRTIFAVAAVVQACSAAKRLPPVEQGDGDV